MVRIPLCSSILAFGFVAGSAGAAETIPFATSLDGVVLITQLRAEAGGVTPGDAPGFPVTISTHGSYRLASNLSVPNQFVHAIEITAENVALDLNGFSIGGYGTKGTGIGVFSSVAHVTVKNGTISGMGASGVVIAGEGHVANVRARNNQDYGIQVWGGVVENNVATDNGFAIYVGGPLALSFYSVIRGNRVGGQVGLRTLAVACPALVHDNMAGEIRQVRFLSGGTCVLNNNWEDRGR